MVETVASSITSTKQFIGGEERDGSGTVTKQFFFGGQRNASTNYFYAMDQLGSVRTLGDSNGDVQAARAFTPYGQQVKLEGSQISDFSFAGMYLHERSGLNLTMYRAYSPSLGRWLSRDPLEAFDGSNFYAYVENDPCGYVDDLGLQRRRGGGGGGGRGNRRRGDRRNRRENCRSINCCFEENRRCQFGCIAVWLGMGMSTGWYNSCARCCYQRRANCMADVSTGKKYPTKNFDCAVQCYDKGE